MDNLVFGPTLHQFSALENCVIVVMSGLLLTTPAYVHLKLRMRQFIFQRTRFSYYFK